MADTKISLETDGVTAVGTDRIPAARSGANKYVTPAYIAEYIRTLAQTLTDKTLDNSNTATLKDALFTLQDDADPTKQLRFQLSGITSGQTRTLTVPDASDTLVGRSTTDTLSNKTLNNTNTASLKDTLFSLEDDGDATKKLAFQLSGITAGQTRTLTVPDASGTLSLLGLAQTWTATQTMTAATALTLGAAGGNTGLMTFKGTTSGVVSLSVADVAGTWTLKLPATAGSNGQVLQTDGAGVTSWATPSGGGSPGGSGTEVQYRNGGAFGAMSGTAWDDTNRSLTITGATVTTSKPLLDLSQTWNASAVTFTALKLNVTFTAAQGASLLMDLQNGGASRFSISQGGNVTIGNGGAITLNGGGGVTSSGTIAGQILQVQSGGNIQISNGSDFSAKIYRDSSQNGIAIRADTTAQSLRVYNTFTDASNYERASLIWSSNVFYLKAENAGTGSARLMIPVTGSVAVASLPSASTAGAGARAFVTDANATTYLSTVAGGGSNKVPVVSDGTNWLIG